MPLHCQKTLKHMRMYILYLTLGGLLSCSGKSLLPTHIDVNTANPYSSGQDFSQVTMDFSGMVKNTYTSTVEVKRLDWHLFSNEAQIQNGTQEINLKIAPRKEGEISLRLTLPTQTIHEGDLNPAPLAQVRLEGTLFLDADGETTTKKVYWVGEHFEPMQPKLTLDAGTARRKNLAELVFTLSLQNTNQFKLVINKIEYSMKVMGVDVAQGTAAQGQVLRAGAIFEYDVSKVVGKSDFFDLAKTIGRADTVPYEAVITIYSADKVWTREFKDKIVF